VKLTTHLHLVPRSKNEWSYISTPQYAFMAWCLVKKHRDNFTFMRHDSSVNKETGYVLEEGGSNPDMGRTVIFANVTIAGPSNGYRKLFSMDKSADKRSLSLTSN
jgi:hypothetical protein